MAFKMKEYSAFDNSDPDKLPADFEEMVKTNSTNSAGGSINVGATKIATRKNGKFTPIYYQA